jgi:hypothetical protein
MHRRAQPVETRFTRCASLWKETTSVSPTTCQEIRPRGRLAAPGAPRQLLPSGKQGLRPKHAPDRRRETSWHAARSRPEIRSEGIDAHTRVGQSSYIATRGSEYGAADPSDRTNRWVDNDRAAAHGSDPILRAGPVAVRSGCRQGRRGSGRRISCPRPLSHNTVTVADAEQAESFGAFRCGGQGAVRDGRGVARRDQAGLVEGVVAFTTFAPGRRGCGVTASDHSARSYARRHDPHHASTVLRAGRRDGARVLCRLEPACRGMRTARPDPSRSDPSGSVVRRPCAVSDHGAERPRRAVEPATAPGAGRQGPPAFGVVSPRDERRPFGVRVAEARQRMSGLFPSAGAGSCRFWTSNHEESPKGPWSQSVTRSHNGASGVASVTLRPSPAIRGGDREILGNSGMRRIRRGARFDVRGRALAPPLREHVGNSGKFPDPVTD